MFLKMSSCASVGRFVRGKDGHTWPSEPGSVAMKM
jgi:hypothetical protein